MAARQHCGEGGLDALTDHQHVARIGEAHRAATAGTEHHLLRIDGRFPGAIAGNEGAMDAMGVPSPPFVTSATIAGQMPLEGCFRAA